MQSRYERGPGAGRTRSVGRRVGLVALVLSAMGLMVACIAVPYAGGWRRTDGLVISSPVYTVAQVQTGLLWQPHAWLRRTVWVYAVATHATERFCPYPIATCKGALPVLADRPGAAARGLPLVWGGTDPIRAQLRRLPLIAAFVPPQAPHWGRPAAYRVTLRLAAGAACHTCFAAVLVDASPVAGL